MYLGTADHAQGGNSPEKRHKFGVFRGVSAGFVVVQSLSNDTKFVFGDDSPEDKNVIERGVDDFDRGIVGWYIIGLLVRNLIVGREVARSRTSDVSVDQTSYLVVVREWLKYGLNQGVTEINGFGTSNF